MPLLEGVQSTSSASQYHAGTGGVAHHSGASGSGSMSLSPQANSWYQSGDPSSSHYDHNIHRRGSISHTPGNTMPTPPPPPGGPSTLPIPGPQSNNAPTTAATLMREGPRDFTIIKAAGDGSFGTVSLADWKSPLPSGTMLSPMQHPTTRPEYVGKRLVAIKRMKKPFKSWNDCLKLKELKSLLDIPHHANIIPLYDAFLDPSTKELHFVFECMEGNLYQLTKSRKGRPLAGGLVAAIFKQIIHGLHHIHQHGYFHRDMKPENLLITTTGLDDYPAFQSDPRNSAPPERDVIVIVKLADFGLARETASIPPYTEYVSTRWYRGPEVLLRSKSYSNPVDLWALGTILAELVNLKPLFPGDSEVDQIMQICELLGDPMTEYGFDSRGRRRGGGPWQEGLKMASSVGFQWPKAPPVKFSSLFSSRVPIELIDCIEDLLRYDPAVRFTTSDCLRHPYLLNVAPRLQPATESNRTEQTPTATLPDVAIVDPTAARQALPPSHSNMPSNIRPAFGESNNPAMPMSVTQQQQNSMTSQHMPFFRPQLQMSVDGGAIAPQRKEDGIGAYPQQASEQSANLQPYPATSIAYSKSRSDSLSLQSGNFGSQLPAKVHPHHATQALYDGRADESPVGSKQVERRKGWGMTFPSVFSGHHSSSNAGLGANNNNTGLSQTLDSRPVQQSRNPSFAGASSGHENTLPPINDISISGLPSDAQAHGAATGSAPLKEGMPSDAKKARKEAEKAARQNEKAKRLAQEKAARDRARAVMQKRNQIMTASDGKEQVEWLSNGVGTSADKGKAKQPSTAGNNALSPAESPRPAQPSGGVGLLPMATNGISANNQGNMTFLQQQYRTPTSALSSHYSPSIASPLQFHSPSGPYSQMLMGAMRGTPRPASIASYATNESDPGPYGGSRRLMAGHPGLKQRQTSASSLSSGLDTLAHSTGSHRFFVGSNDSFALPEDVRSVHSLDSQLVSNMEAMSAAERSAGLSIGSPAPTQPPSALTGVNQPGSRQGRPNRSRASSLQRGGSASPIHHTSTPRFHPYGGGIGSSGTSGPSPQSHHIPLSATSAPPPPQPVPTSPHSRTSSSQSYYTQFPMPPVNMEDGSRRGLRPSGLWQASNPSAYRPQLDSRGEGIAVDRAAYPYQQALPNVLDHNAIPDPQYPSQHHLYHHLHQSEGHRGDPSPGSSGGVGSAATGSWAGDDSAPTINTMWVGPTVRQSPIPAATSINSHSASNEADGDGCASRGAGEWSGTGVAPVATRLPPFSSLIASALEEDSDMVDVSGAYR